MPKAARFGIIAIVSILMWAAEGLLPGTAITALFSETDVTGSAGCNNYTGALTPVSDYFTVAPATTTQNTCDEPAGIMEQEQAYLTALASLTGFRWQQELVNETTVITAGQLFYTLADGGAGVINLVSTR